MLTIVQQYLQDAIRYFQRKPFFFNETDNTAVVTWQAENFYTQGATIQATALTPTPLVAPTVLPYTVSTAYNLNDIIIDTNGNYQQVTVPGITGLVAPTWATTVGTTTVDGAVTWTLLYVASTIAAVNLLAGVTGTTAPLFTPTVYTPPTTLTSPPQFTATSGTTVDGTALWATVGPWSVVYTQLSTVPNQNQYAPPLDYVAPRRVEVTWSGNLRIGMNWLSYDELRDYDVIRPSPPTTYPSWYSWYQQQLYFWPYPVNFYPITLSYRTAPPLPIGATDSNFWTTTSEGLIRHFAMGRILEGVVHDAEAAQNHYDLAKQELNALVSQRMQQISSTEGTGIPAASW